jgi:hypothetical protein
MPAAGARRHEPLRLDLLPGKQPGPPTLCERRKQEVASSQAKCSPMQTHAPPSDGEQA